MKHIVWLTLLFFSPVIYATGYSNYYCDKTYQSVKVGDTMETVHAACSEPTTTNTRAEQTSTPTSIIQWVYSLGLFSIKNVTFNLPTITINFKDQKVIEIIRSDLPVATNGYCGINALISIGDSMSQVLFVCGQPNFINNTQRDITTTKSIMEWTYNNGPYKPQIIFDFENGQVTKIASGQLGK